jgi:hypothetical protein
MRNMIVPRRLGHHSASNREVYLLTLDDLDAPFTLSDIQGGHFTCFCALNAEGLPTDELGKFCSHLLQLGCAYLCVWGPDCERVHDIMDEEIVGDNPPQSYLGCVMTTWHAKDSLKDSVSFFLDNTEPDDTYAPNGCNAALIITRAGNDWNATIEKFVTAEIGSSPS